MWTSKKWREGWPHFLHCNRWVLFVRIFKCFSFFIYTIDASARIVHNNCRITCITVCSEIFIINNNNNVTCLRVCAAYNRDYPGSRPNLYQKMILTKLGKGGPETFLLFIWRICDGLYTELPPFSGNGLTLLLGVGFFCLWGVCVVAWEWAQATCSSESCIIFLRHMYIFS